MDSIINIDPKHLISNGSSLNEIRFYKRIWIGYLHPPIVFVGLITNLMVLVILPKMTNTLSNKSRFQYMCLAGFNFLTLMTFHFLQVFLGDGLFFASNGKFYFYLEKTGTISCKLCWFSWFLCMALANYCYVEFCIERTIGVSAPLKAINILTKKVRIMIWLTIVIVPSLFIALFAAYVKEILINSRAVDGITCGVPTSIGDMRIIYCIAACFLIYIAHVVIMIFCNIVILTKLHQASSSRLKLSKHFSSSSRKDTRTTMTLVVLSGIQVLLYLPAAFSCAAFCFVFFHEHDFRLKYYNEFVELNNSLGLFNAMTCISHSVNFFVYFFRMDAFRKEVLQMLFLGSSTNSGTSTWSSRIRVD